jgi:hypothetical protein
MALGSRRTSSITPSLEHHIVFLPAAEAVFIFSGDDAPAAVREILLYPPAWAAANHSQPTVAREYMTR